MNNYCSNNMCSNKFQVPTYTSNQSFRHSTSSNYIPTNNQMYGTMNNGFYPQTNDDRFFIAPFLVGGLAGTALGYGIANNNNNNNGGYYMPPPPIYYYPPAMPYTYNNYYY